jgi:glycolate oxidase FAD binding subunit
LSVRLSGSETGVQALARTLGGEPLADASAFWRCVREQTHPFFGDDEPLWRVAVKSTAPTLSLPGRQLIEWNGALRWLKSDAGPQAVRRVAAEGGGHAIWFRGARDRRAVFHPLAEHALRLQYRLKQAFDPAGILNRGRLHPDW